MLCVSRRTHDMEDYIRFIIYGILREHAERAKPFPGDSHGTGGTNNGALEGWDPSLEISYFNYYEEGKEEIYLSQVSLEERKASSVPASFSQLGPGTNSPLTAFNIKETLCTPTGMLRSKLNLSINPFNSDTSTFAFNDVTLLDIHGLAQM
ncbi:hypothetical protein J6590_013312 [Homalodisca vitripennis]|nr:hypothetical protein J6590_013312 [Homalodisca vitripennis]